MANEIEFSVNPDVHEVSGYVNADHYATVSIAEALKAPRNLVFHDANGEVFRIDEDGTMTGDLDAAIALAEQQVRGFLPALRAIKRLRG